MNHRQVTDAPIVKFQADTEVYRFDWYLIPMFFAFEFYLVFFKQIIIHVAIFE